MRDGRHFSFLLSLDILVGPPHRKCKANDRRPDRKAEDAERRESERERDQRERPRHSAGSFHPSWLDRVPKDQLKNGDTQDKHEKGRNGLPLSQEPNRERDVNDGTSYRGNETDKQDEDRERDEKRHPQQSVDDSRNYSTKDGYSDVYDEKRVVDRVEVVKESIDHRSILRRNSASEVIDDDITLCKNAEKKEENDDELEQQQRDAN